jgi:uncharacterized membrane protein
MSQSFLSYFNLDFSHLFVMFLIFAFTGWCCEEVYVSSLQKKLVKRGMLFGPVCPIYGFGGIIIYFCLYHWKDSYLVLFLAAFVLTSALEYFSSWLLEKLFHAKWWDYSKRPFNLNGRCCLLNSTLFGLLGIVEMHYLEPLVHKLIYIDVIQPYFEYIAIALALILSVDILFTVRRLVDFNSTLVKFKEYGEQLKERYEGESWFKAESLHSMIASIKERAKIEKGRFTESFMKRLEGFASREKSVAHWLRKFPTMSSKDYAQALDHIRQSIKEYALEQKKLLKADAQIISKKIKNVKKVKTQDLEADNLENKRKE